MIYPVFEMHSDRFTESAWKGFTVLGGGIALVSDGLKGAVQSSQRMNEYKCFP